MNQEHVSTADSKTHTFVEIEMHFCLKYSGIVIYISPGMKAVGEDKKRTSQG